MIGLLQFFDIYQKNEERVLVVQGFLMRVNNRECIAKLSKGQNV